MRHSTRFIVVAATLSLLIVACGEQPASKQDSAALSAALLPPGEGRLAVPGGEIWYRVTGTGTGTPVLLLHGGPGFSSFYLKSLEALGDERRVVRYDQLGGGKSGGMTDTSMMTIAHFVAELDSLRAHLGFDRVHVVGHSWGTILGLEYYQAHPQHVASLTLASAALDIPTWEKNARRMVRTLPDSLQQTIAAAEKEGKFDSPGYQAALGEFYSRYVWRRPVQVDLDSTFATANQTIYNYMQGPSEFTITGTLKTYDATSLLKSVTVPTLFTVGEFDEADPPTIRKHAAMVAGATFAQIPGAAHITTWDNPEEMTRVVREFLRAADAKPR